MKPEGYDYDPDRSLWVCGRRSFLFLGGMAALATAVGGSSAASLEEYWKPAYGLLPPPDDLVEVIPLGPTGSSALGPSQVVSRSVIEPYGITEVERGLWHLSHDGSVMWRRNAGRPVVKGMLGGREVMFPERGGLWLPPARSGAAWPSNPPQAINRRKERA